MQVAGVSSTIVLSNPSQSTVACDGLLHNVWPLSREPKEGANNGEQSSALMRASQAI